MKSILAKRTSWKNVLARHKPLILPAAHDALTARIIEQAGFPAYQIGGFALAGAMHAVPDLDLEHFGEKSAVVRKIVHASDLPVLVDADDGYGDAKNVTRTIQEYEAIGASAIFIEDQVAPKRCGHMGGNRVIEIKDMVNKIKAAQAGKSNPDLFLLARTDAIEPNGVRNAIKRGEAYLRAGADGVYLEGPTTMKELERIGRAFKGSPLAVSILEGGGKTPWVSPAELYSMGFSMILYPTSILFRLTHAISEAAKDLLAGRPMDQSQSVTLKLFEDLVEMPHWEAIEKSFPVEDP
jgi:2-methylisocitrate lyase-like PEP mutase family enzyme